ncbi:MAG: aminoglycoside phosphotransferase family protein [Myxococcota bacterium]
MSVPFPLVPDSAAFDAFMREGPVSELLERIGCELGMGPLRRPSRGSAIVGVGTDEVLKVFCPIDRAHADAERTSLEALAGRLPVPTARVRDHGELEGWPWIRMDRLPGEELAEAWASFAPHEHRSLATQLGELLAVLHGVEAPTGIERVDWEAWCAERVPASPDLQRAKGCPEALLAQIPDLLERADLRAGPTGWLHTEIMREHLLVERTPAGPVLSGVFDFEPSWVGPRSYELASVGLFFSAGDGGVLREVLRAAGLEAAPDRLMGMALMHRYSNLGWYHRRLGGPLELDALAEAWFGTAG